MAFIGPLTQDTHPLPADQLALAARCYSPSGTWQEFRPDTRADTIHGCLEEVVAQFPQRVALKSPTRQFTFAELNHAANRLAELLLQMLGIQNEPVGCLFDQDIVIGVAYYGILKSGKIFVEISSLEPDFNNRHILQDTQMRLLLTNTQNLAQAQRLKKTSGGSVERVINLDELVFPSRKMTATKTGGPLQVSPDDIAYLVYTSGSTGKPKGVAHTHRSDSYIIWEMTNTYYLTPDDSVINLSATRIFMPPNCVGAAVCKFDMRRHGFPALARWLRQEKITWIITMPTTLRQFLQSLPSDFQLPDLRVIMAAGEPLMPEDLELCKRVVSPSCLFVYSFSMSETRRICLYLIDPHTYARSGKIPVGYPALAKEIYLLDDKGEEVGAGEVGELAVRGPGIAHGYWNRAELNRSRFLPDPEGGDRRIFLTGDLGKLDADGALYHLGRRDDMVKVRGFRVEPAPIEATLRQIAGVDAAAVLALPEHDGEVRLVGYVVVTCSDTTVSSLRSSLASHLPNYMIPSTFVFLGEMPTTSSGKVDRQNLPEPPSTRPLLDVDYAPPRTPVEDKLVVIWADVLGLDEVGVHDNFLDLGGHSLLATRIVTRVIDTFGIELALEELFQAPSVGEMALVVVEHMAARAEPELLVDALEDVENPESAC